MNVDKIIKHLFEFSPKIRYVAIYHKEALVFKQRQAVANNSDASTDKFEELLVNPTLLKLASQRGNIDCGGLRHLIIGYGHFYQLVKAIEGGHVSICLEKTADLNGLPEQIFDYLSVNFPEIEM